MNNAVLLQLAPAVGALIFVIAAYIQARAATAKTVQVGNKLEQVHEQINGHMAELLTATKEIGHAQGLEQGRAGTGGTKL